MSGNTQYAKNLRIRCVAVNSTPQQVLPVNKSRALASLKNIGSNPINISVHYGGNDGADAPGDLATDYWPLAAGEVLPFDKGIAPLTVWAVSASGSTLAMITG